MRKVIHTFTILTLLAACTSMHGDGELMIRNKVWSENETTFVLHDYLVGGVGGKDDFQRLRFIDKKTGSLLSENELGPFALIESFGDNKYFAALSMYTASTPNFAVFDTNGKVLLSELVDYGTGHCSEVRLSVSQYIWWFDYSSLESVVKFSDDGSEVLVSGYVNNVTCRFKFPE